MKFGKRALGMALSAGVMGSVALIGTTAHAAPVEDAAMALACIGPSFSGTLGVDQSICWGNYHVTMQNNGDLVLRDRQRACYASGTRAPGDATATFVGNVAGKPYVDINSASQGRVGRVMGAHRTPHLGNNASVNSRGEFWIGYKKVGYC